MERKNIRDAGLKVTLPRLKILDMLENSPNKHLSAEDVYKALMNEGEEIGLATIYRVLTQFEGADLVNRHHFEGGNSVFELNQGEHHDHIMCIKCNRVEEFVDKVIEQRQSEIASRMGYEIKEHCLHLYGVCSDCAKEALT